MLALDFDFCSSPSQCLYILAFLPSPHSRASLSLRGVMCSPPTWYQISDQLRTQRHHSPDITEYHELDGAPISSLLPRINVSNDPNRPEGFQQRSTSFVATPTTTELSIPNSRLGTLRELHSTAGEEHNITARDSATASDNKSTNFWRRHRLALAAAVPISYGVAALLMLVYFLDLYLTLPRTETGELPRISPIYSLWPYMARIGVENFTTFVAFATIVSFFFIGTFAADVALAWHTQPGYWLRRIRLVFSLAWGSMFIWLAIAGKDMLSHIPLYIISIKSLLSISIKSLTWMMDYLCHRHFPPLRTDPTATTSKRWKDIIMILAFRESFRICGNRNMSNSHHYSYRRPGQPGNLPVRR